MKSVKGGLRTKWDTGWENERQDVEDKDATCLSDIVFYLFVRVKSGVSFNRNTPT